MTDTLDLSFVVPVYNAERFIEECLDSVYSKAGAFEGRIEVVAVDDSSPDGSVDVIKRLQQKYPSLRLVRQENKGPGGARNTGVRQARGRYIWFLDSDDWIIGDWDKELMPLIASDRYDAIAICGSDYYTDRGVVRRFDFNGLHKEYTGPNMLLTERYTVCPPLTIYRRSFLVDNKLAFAEHLYHEDVEFALHAYYLLRRVALVNNSFYLIRQNPNSITRSLNFKRNFDVLLIADMLHDFQQKYVDKRYRRVFSSVISMLLNAAMPRPKEMPDDVRRKIDNAIAERKHLLPHYFYSKKMKYLCEGFLFALLPLSPVWIFNNLQLKHH